MNKYIQLNTEIENLKNLKKSIPKIEFDERKKDLSNTINLELIDIQEKIDISNSDEIYRIKENISRIKTLISQINIEFSLISNDYDEKINTYKFPESLQVMNQKIINNKKDLKKAKKEYNNYLEMISKEEEYLNSLLNQKNKIVNMLNNKKVKMSNNAEILAVVEKKNNILKNKNKILLDIDKKIQNTRNIILDSNNFFNIKIKELDNQKKTKINKLQLSLKKIEKKTYNIPEAQKIKEKEISVVNQQMNNLEENYFIEIKKEEEKLENDLKILDKKLEDLNDEKKTLEEEYEYSEKIMEDKVKELMNLIPNLKKDSNELSKKINLKEQQITELNSKNIIKRIDVLNEETLSLDSEKESEEKKSIREYNKFKNMYDDKFDELNSKKFKFEKKIISLNKKIISIENNSCEKSDVNVESKKYLVNLLKNLKSI